MHLKCDCIHVFYITEHVISNPIAVLKLPWNSDTVPEARGHSEIFSFRLSSFHCYHQDGCRKHYSISRNGCRDGWGDPQQHREQRLMRRLNTQSQDLISSFGRMIRNFLGTAISKMNWESFCCLNWEKTTTAISSEGKKSACHMETANSTFLINSKWYLSPSHRTCKQTLS